MSLNVHSIETFGTHEGPGIRLVVFLQGCYFRCLYCHNPDTWAVDIGKRIAVSEIMALLEKQKPYLKHGGLTVSGGEPLIQRVELLPLFQAAQRQNIHTTLDTNGSILDDAAKELLKFTNLVLLDVKHINNDQHQKLTGQSNQTVLNFAEHLASTQKPFWLRYVLVPGITDQEESLHQWGQHFRGSPGLQRVEILPFHTLGAYKYDALGVPNPLAGVQPPKPEEIQTAKEIFSQYFDRVYIR